MADSAGREVGNAPLSLRSAAMISITTKSPYALNALVELYRQGGSEPVPIAELARRRQIPVQFLEHLFATLRRAGILRSQRGVKGGYSFARPPEEVTVLELVELLDGPLGVGALGVFAEAAQAAASVLREATVASIAEQEIRSAGAPMYHI
jgi:Rrf2 family cysteine metabolism transcriptional repressor